jgi:hypothetical protein
VSILGWKLIGYRAIHGKNSRYFCFIVPFEDKVVLVFEHGKMLSDPHGVLEGTCSQVRQVVLKKKSDVRKTVLIPLILEAAMIAMEKHR